MNRFTLNTLKLSASTLMLLTFILIATACGGDTNEVVLKGIVDGASNELLLLRTAADNSVETIDSTRTDKDGVFEFNITVTSPSFFLLQLKGQIEPIIMLVSAGEKVDFKGSKHDYSNSYTISGSQGSTLVQELNQQLNSVVNVIDSLSYLFRSSKEHPKFDSIKVAVDSAYNRIIRNHKDYTVRFIKENRYSLASVLALYQQYDKARQVLNKRDDFELFKLVDNSLYPLYPDNTLVANLHSNVKKMSKQLALFDKRQDMFDVGEYLPNVELPLMAGDTISLFDVKKRYIFVDFWATWCNECIPNNKKLSEVYTRFWQKGFQIVQVSLDDNLNGIEPLFQNEGYEWIVALDYLQWDSPILDTLKINSIPSNYLIDRNGLVIARNLSVSELSQKLEELIR